MGDKILRVLGLHIEKQRTMDLGIPNWVLCMSNIICENAGYLVAQLQRPLCLISLVNHLLHSPSLNHLARDQTRLSPDRLRLRNTSISKRETT